MTESEIDKVADSVRMLNWVLDRDKDANFTRIQLEPTERRLLDEARIGVTEMLQTSRKKAKAKVEKIEAYIDAMQRCDIQGDLFGSDGKPLTPTDEHGRVKPTERTSNIDQLPAAEDTPGQTLLDLDGGPVDPQPGEPLTQVEDIPADEWIAQVEAAETAAREQVDDNAPAGEQAPTEEATPAEEPAPAVDWSLKKDKTALYDAIRDSVKQGSGKIQTRDTLATNGLTALDVTAAWDELEKLGKDMKPGGLIRRSGKWYVTEGEATPAAVL